MSEGVLFARCWKVSLVVPAFKNVGERSTAKNYHPVSFPSVVSKVFEKHVNNRIVIRKNIFASLFSVHNTISLNKYV